MKNTRLVLIVIALYCTSNFSSAQDVRLHVNPRWEECSFQLDPSLTQEEWHQFTDEAAMVIYFRSLTDAKPMGAGKFEFSILQWNTRIDETEDAWNDTFVHPDSTHWLIGGPQLPFPGLSVRAGITPQIDAGVYWTIRPGANYGLMGAQIQYNLINDSVEHWAASARLSANSLYGPDDLGLIVFGVDVLASKDFAIHSDWIAASPYIGVSTYLSNSNETTDAVDLENENIVGVQAMLGAVAYISIARLAVEYNIGTVPSFSYKIGVNFGF